MLSSFADSNYEAFKIEECGSESLGHSCKLITCSLTMIYGNYVQKYIYG